MVLLREQIGDSLRRRRLQQGRTLRQVSQDARVSLGYLSEVERGQKEASSELLASICGALDLRLSELLINVTAEVEKGEVRDRISALPPVTGPQAKTPVGAVVAA
jgi:transcriptional regulator with XRE-family HTH domain